MGSHPDRLCTNDVPVVAELLKLPHLVDKDRMPEMQVGRSGIKPSLDAQRFAASELFDELRFHEQL